MRPDETTNAPAAAYPREQRCAACVTNATGGRCPDCGLFWYRREDGTMACATPVERVVQNYRDAHEQAKALIESGREPKGLEDRRYASIRFMVGVSIGLRMAAGYLGVPDEVLRG